MANLEASLNGWTGNISVPGNVKLDDYDAIMEALKVERALLYASRNAGEITMEEWQTKASIVSLLAAELYGAFAEDTLPAVEWTEPE